MIFIQKMQTPPPSENQSSVGSVGSATDWDEYSDLMQEMLYFYSVKIEQYPVWMVRQAMWETLRGDRGYIGLPRSPEWHGNLASPTPASGSRANLSEETPDTSTGRF